MYVIAVIGDLFSLIPILSIPTNFITAMALGIAGSHTGVSLFSSERIPATLVVMLLETIPFVKIVPSWTIRVYFAKKGAKESEEQAA